MNHLVVAHECVKNALWDRVRNVQSADMDAHDAIKALDAAGLLATPAMRQAVEACKRLALAFDGRVSMVAATDLCISVGKGALAEEAERAPKPPRQVYGIHEFVGDPEPTNWCVTRNDHQWLMNLTKPEAHAICLSLRGLESGK